MKSEYFEKFLRILASGILVQTLWFKFSGAPESVWIFSQLGVEPWGRVLSGVIEAVAALMLIFGKTKVLGAIIIFPVMFSAIFSHLFLLGVSIRGDNGLLFFLAIFIFGLASFIIFQNRKNLIPGILVHYLMESAVVRSIAIFALMIFISILLLIFVGEANPNTQNRSSFANGKVLWQKNNCVSCHSLVGLGGHIGPDLTNVYSEKGEGYITYIVLQGKDKMPGFQFSQIELKEIISYLKRIDEQLVYPSRNYLAPVFGSTKQTNGKN